MNSRSSPLRREDPEATDPLAVVAEVAVVASEVATVLSAVTDPRVREEAVAASEVAVVAEVVPALRVVRPQLPLALLLRNDLPIHANIASHHEG